MSMTARNWIAAFAVVAAMSSSPLVHADARNEVRAVTFDEDGGITRVHVRGAQTPTFTVYKLERPSRVVVDLPQSRLADSLRGQESATVLTPSTWAVSTIAAQQLDDGAARVIVTLARPGSYDIKTVGNELVVLVSPRDPAPKNANPAELARIAAESEQAKQQARAAEQARLAAEKSSEAAERSAKQSQAEAAAAKAEAERLRKSAAEQAAKAEAALRAVETAKQQLAAKQKQSASAADLQRAQQAAQAAQAEAARAKAQAAKASSEAETAKRSALQAQAEAEKMKQAAEQARRDALADAARAKADAAKARDDMERTQAETAKAREEAARRQLEASKAREEMARAKAEAQRVREEVARKQLEATKAREEMARTKADAERVRAEIEKQQKLANQARAEMQRAQQEAERAKEEVARAQAEAQALVAKSRAEADEARREVAAARAEVAADRREVEADRRKAEVARKDAEKMLASAKAQLATLEQKSLAAQQLDDKARATLAAAQAREEAARKAVAQANREREAAESAAKRALAARDRSATADRERLAAEAKQAEERLATARHAAAEADARRLAAEQAATRAKMDLEQTKSALASVEQQRTSAIAAATEAARKRSEAEAAASDAARRRDAAEVAANEAAKKRREAEVAASEAAKRRGQAESARARAEAERVAALEAARAAEAAKVAADKQREIAEGAARKAVAAKHDAETSLAALETKRAAAERAADELAARAKAEAKAQADMVAAQSRKASKAEVEAARREVARLTEQREHAEAALADRRKAVAQQQAESVRLQTAAAQAKDAADREEKRRTRLAEQRAQEEQALARLEARKVQAQVAQTQTRSTPPPAPRARPAKVNNVTFKGDDDSGVVEIAVAGDGDVQLGDISSRRVELIVDNAELAPKLERTLDVSRFGSPVTKVSTFRDRHHPGRVRLVAELASPAIPTVLRDKGWVRWRFAANPVAQRKAPARPQVVGGFGAASTPVAQQSVSQVPSSAGRGRRIYHGVTVDLDFKDAPLHDLLRIISETGNISVVVPEAIDPKVTVKLKRVPWDQALEVILASHGLWYRREGNIYRIDSRKVLDAEDEAEAARRAAMAASEMPKPQIVTLNYASADELKPKFEGMLSPKGHIDVDGRTNSLIVSDIAANRQQIADLARSLDTQTPQITIEARIVEARSTFVRQFGIQWGGRALMGAAGGNATGLVFPSSIGVVGGNTDNQTNDNGISALPSDFAINLPAATGTGEGGAIGLSLGSVGGNFNINLRLSALEDTGTVRIISAPKITVLNNKAALIRQGVSIPISVVSAAGTQTQFVQADLKLEVTPYVSQADCAIAMQLNVTKNEPDFVNTGARGDPTILRKEAQTTMLVNDGETSVLGGIYTRNTGLAYKKVPFLADLPVIGWFFKSRRENDDRTEILVFITPKITNKARLHCGM